MNTEIDSKTLFIETQSTKLDKVQDDMTKANDKINKREKDIRIREDIEQTLRKEKEELKG